MNKMKHLSIRNKHSPFFYKKSTNYSYIERKATISLADEIERITFRIREKQALKERVLARLLSLCINISNLKLINRLKNLLDNLISKIDRLKLYLSLKIRLFYSYSVLTTNITLGHAIMLPIIPMGPISSSVMSQPAFLERVVDSPRTQVHKYHYIPNIKKGSEKILFTDNEKRTQNDFFNSYYLISNKKYLTLRGGNLDADFIEFIAAILAFWWQFQEVNSFVIQNPGAQPPFGFGADRIAKIKDYPQVAPGQGRGPHVNRNQNFQDTRPSKTIMGAQKTKGEDDILRPRELHYIMNEHSGLTRYANKIRDQRILRGMKSLETELRKGNTNPGLGTKPVKGVPTVFEARHDSGARLYFRERGGEDVIQIVGKSTKGHDQVRVIALIKQLLESLMDD